jgi:hypothetical protein
MLHFFNFFAGISHHTFGITSYLKLHSTYTHSTQLTQILNHYHSNLRAVFLFYAQLEATFTHHWPPHLTFAQVWAWIAWKGRLLKHPIDLCKSCDHVIMWCHTSFPMTSSAFCLSFSSEKLWLRMQVRELRMTICMSQRFAWANSAFGPILRLAPRSDPTIGSGWATIHCMISFLCMSQRCPWSDPANKQSITHHTRTVDDVL